MHLQSNVGRPARSISQLIQHTPNKCVCVCVLVINPSRRWWNPEAILSSDEILTAKVYSSSSPSQFLSFSPLLPTFLLLFFLIFNCTLCVHLLFISSACSILFSFHLSSLLFVTSILFIQMKFLQTLFHPHFLLRLLVLTVHLWVQPEVLSSCSFLSISLFKSSSSLLRPPSHFLAFPLCRWLAV